VAGVDNQWPISTWHHPRGGRGRRPRTDRERVLDSIGMGGDAAEDTRQSLYDEYLAVPSHRRAEIINGTLYVMPRPSPKHANAATVLGGALSGPLQFGDGGPGGWWILFEPELHLVPFEPLSPDLAGWRVARLPELPELAYFTLAPDWVCEVLSPSTTRMDREEKLPIYADAGVGHVWLVDPIERSLEVYTLGPTKRWRQVRMHGADERVRAAPFEEVELDLARLWSKPVTR